MERDHKLTVHFKCKDYLLKECEFEVKRVQSADEMMKLIDVHVDEAHRHMKVSPKTLEKIRASLKGTG